MNREENKFIFIFVIFAASMLLIASFGDFAIGKALIDQNSIYGYLFQTFGMFPQAVVPMIAGGVLAVYGSRQEHVLVKGLLTLAGSVYAYWSVWGGVDIMMSYIAQSLSNVKRHKALGVASNGAGEAAKYSFALEAVITLVLTAIGLTIVYYWLRTKSDEDFQRLLLVSVVAVAVVLLSNSIVSTMKGNWGRFRPYETEGVLTAAKGHFTDWWQLNGKNGHHSFPSGHTIGAAAALMFPFFVDRKNIKWQRILAYAGLIFTALMMLGRVRIGAHWLSDTTMSLIIGGLVTFSLTKVLGWAYIEEEKI